MEDKPRFEVLILAVIFDTTKKKILIGKKGGELSIPETTWVFPGGRANHEEDLDQSLKKAILKKTGYTTKNLGAIFAKTYPEKRDLASIYFFCEHIEGEEKAGDDLTELKWVDPEELENHFTTSFHPKLKEFILNLK